MTILYKPVLIESAEQAETLPLNTMAISADGVDPAIRKEDGWRGIFGDPPYSHAEMVSDYALVPIEAEEEWTVGHDGPAWAPGTEEWAREFQTHEPGRRLFRRSTTPWEPA